MSERGDATVEFLGMLVVLVIPLLYVVLAVGAVSAGAMGWTPVRARRLVFWRRIERARTMRGVLFP